jgi:hypothetical protein
VRIKVRVMVVMMKNYGTGRSGVVVFGRGLFWEAVDQVRCGSKEGKWPVRVEVFSHFRVRDAPASARVWGASGRLGMMKYLYRQHTPARYFRG